MLLTWDPSEIVVEGAYVDSGVCVTKHTAGMVVNILKLCVLWKKVCLSCGALQGPVVAADKTMRLQTLSASGEYLANQDKQI